MQFNLGKALTGIFKSKFKRKSVEELHQLLIENEPLSLNKLKDLRLKPKHIASGAYRNIYRLKGTEFIVKIPKGTDGLAHSLVEIKTIRQILRFKRKYKLLQEYIPFVLYDDLQTGIIVMEYYKALEDYDEYGRIADAIQLLVRNLIYSLWPPSITRWSIDIHEGNIGLTKEGGFKIIDFGYFNDTR